MVSPSISSIVRTRFEQNFSNGSGIFTLEPNLGWMLALHFRSISASMVKLNSTSNVCPMFSIICFISGVLNVGSIARSDVRIPRSIRKYFSTHGYWTFTTTLVPSCNFAMCAWPIDAAPNGFSSNSAKWSEIFPPSSSSTTFLTTENGSGGQSSRRTLSSSLYASGSVPEPTINCAILM